MVSDSGSNFKAAIELFDNTEKIPCAGHRLNSCVFDIFKIIKISEKYKNGEQVYSIFEQNLNGDFRKIEINQARKIEIEYLNSLKKNLNDLLAKCKHLVGSFRHSEGLLRRFREKQLEYHYEVKIKLVQDVVTRWNSTLDMIDSILSNKDALSSMALNIENKTIKPFVPDENEFSILEDLSNLLAPLKELTTSFSGKLYSTITCLYPCIYWMINGGLTDIKMKNECIIQIRYGLMDSLNKRFKYVFDNKLFIASTFLNYKFKKFEFVSDDDERANFVNNAKEYINDLYTQKCKNNTTNVSISNINSSPPATQIPTQTSPLFDLTNAALINHNSKRKNNKDHSISS